MSERIGIAGGGAIASGLACVAAEHGQVVLWARRPDAATAKVERLIERRGGAGAGNVLVSDDLGALRDATFVVEAIAEDQAAKAVLLRELGDAARDGTIMATTTSALSVSALAQASGRPQRFLGLHVFNPVAKMDLVELVFPAAADANTRERARALCQALGKIAVEVPDTPGFVVNRLLFPFLFDAVALLERTGLDPRAVDDCMRMGAGHPMGPLALLDYIGLDVSAAIGRSIGAPVPARIEALIAAGALGKKAGRGFHDY
ncbi:MAG: 3-hydroxyacyl-CoA dehydrogenase family protein [Solirubrobacterales bacterium]|nr:3-hydroxyacyl-CoA dehydrogenase family protein [Solirubrobacterales bacterium]